jgi:hypothetical protein
VGCFEASAGSSTLKGTEKNVCRVARGAGSPETGVEDDSERGTAAAGELDVAARSGDTFPGTLDGAYDGAFDGGSSDGESKGDSAAAIESTSQDAIVASHI